MLKKLAWHQPWLFLLGYLTGLYGYGIPTVSVESPVSIHLGADIEPRPSQRFPVVLGRKWGTVVPSGNHCEPNRHHCSLVPPIAAIWMEEKRGIKITEMKAHSRFNYWNQFLLSCNVLFFPSFCHMKMREKLLTVTCRQPLEIRFSKNSNCWLDDPEAIQEEKTLHHNFVGKSWRASREWYLNAMKWCPSSLREGCLGCAQLRLCWSWKGCYLKQNIEIMSLNANLLAKQRID